MAFVLIMFQGDIKPATAFENKKVSLTCLSLNQKDQEKKRKLQNLVAEVLKETFGRADRREITFTEDCKQCFNVECVL